jgi:CheY-like chemotaxis protein
VLHALGYRVAVAANGVEALERFGKDAQIDLVITDVVMPHMGGVKLVEGIRKLAPKVPVLFTSGYTFDALGEVDELGPGCDFLSKPYGPDELGEKVHHCLIASRSK